MSKPTNRRVQKKPEVSLVRSSAAEYLTFVARSGHGYVEAVIRNFRITAADGKTYATQHYSLASIIFESGFDRMLKALPPTANG